MRRHVRLFFLCAAAITSSCAAAPPKRASAPLVPAPSSGWQSPRPTAGVIGASVTAAAPMSNLAAAMGESASKAGMACGSLVFVWGDVRVMPSARPATLSAGDAKLDGFFVCEEDLPELLQMQRENPRLREAHGGAADLRWADDHFLLRRRWSKGEAALGDLSAAPEGVLQKGELLAVIFAPDPRAPADRVTTMLARVPTYFLLGMWPLSAR